MPKNLDYRTFPPAQRDEVSMPKDSKPKTGLAAMPPEQRKQTLALLKQQRERQAKRDFLKRQEEQKAAARRAEEEKKNQAIREAWWAEKLVCKALPNAERVQSDFNRKWEQSIETDAEYANLIQVMQATSDSITRQHRISRRDPTIPYEEFVGDRRVREWKAKQAAKNQPC